jgi:hypothetical protein
MTSLAEELSVEGDGAFLNGAGEPTAADGQWMDGGSAPQIAVLDEAAASADQRDREEFAPSAELVVVEGSPLDVYLKSECVTSRRARAATDGPTLPQACRRARCPPGR